MLAERTQDHLDLFEEGVEAEYFDTREELKDKIVYYLNEPDKRKIIALAGYNKCMALGLSYNDTMQKLIEDCFEDVHQLKMKVTILGHSYLAKENRKCLTELGKYVDLEVCSPNSFKGMIFNYAIKENKIFGDNWVINLRKKIVIPKFSEAVYVLKSKN